MDTAINFYVRKKSNGAVLFVMRCLSDSERPVATMGVDGGSWAGAPEGTITWDNLTDADFSFFERYRIDNLPEAPATTSVA